MTQERHGVHEWLFLVLGLADLVFEISGVIVDFAEDTGNVDRVAISTVTTVRSSGAIGDVGFVVGRVGVLPVPAALEVLGNNEGNS